MNKKLIRLTESDLHNIVKESVNKILNEWEYAGWINDIEDPIEYDPNDPESVKEREIEDSWREFRDHISNRREMNDRRRKFYDDLKYYPKRVQTSSTLNGEDSQGVASMSMLGDEPKGGWGKKYNDTKKGFNDRYLSRKAPRQPY